MATGNKKEFRFGIENKSYPKRLMKELEAHIKTISKEHREIPKSLGEWKKELSYVKYESDEVIAKLEKQKTLVSSLQEKYKQLHGREKEAAGVQFDRAQKRTELLQTKLDKINRTKSAVETHIKASGSEKDGLMGNVLNAFAGGGIGGVGASLFKSGIGKAGLAGLLALGAMKTFEWLDEKGQKGANFELESLHTSRGLNLPFDMSGLLKKNDWGKKYKKSWEQMMEVTAAIGASTGGALLKQNPAMVEDAAGFAKYNALSYSQVGETLGTGLRSGSIRGTEDIQGYFNTYSAAMAKGVDIGFSKNERIGQLIALTKMGTENTGELLPESFNKLTASFLAIEKAGGVAFRGEKGLEAINMMKRFLTPSAGTTPLFAAFANSGMLPGFKGQAEAMARSKTGVGGIYDKLLPGTQYGIMQTELGKTGGLDVFKTLWNNLKGTTGGAEMMMSAYGVDPMSAQATIFAKLLDRVGGVSNKEFEKQMSDISKTEWQRSLDGVSENALGLKTEMGNYYEAQTSLRVSLVALNNTIETKLTIAIAELTAIMAAEKVLGINSGVKVTLDPIEINIKDEKGNIQKQTIIPGILPIPQNAPPS